MDAFVDLVEQLVTSPWVYGVIFLVAALDGLVPIVPSEATVITAGVFAAAGEPNIVFVIAAACGGAMAGDHTSYAIGHAGGPNVIRRIPEGTRRATTFQRVRRLLENHGGVALLVARYIPGGRTAVTLTTGAIGYPLRRFTPLDALACLSWAGYTGLLGYLGGSAFEDHPLQGLALGFGIALAVAGLVELVQRLLHRRRSAGHPAHVPQPSAATTRPDADDGPAV